MIIDCHSHVWPSREVSGGGSDLMAVAGAACRGSGPQEHVASSEPAAMTFVLGFVSELLGVKIPNDFIREHVAAHEDRMLGFAGVDPMAAGCVGQVEQIASEGHFAGLAMGPAYQGFHPSDSRAMQLYEVAEGAGLPVFFLGGMALPRGAMLEYAQPALLDEAARNFPKLKMVVTHMGYPWIEQTVALLAKNDNVFADVAGLAGRGWLAYKSLNLAHEGGVMEKLLFGSGFPQHSVKEGVEAVYNVNKLTVDSVLPGVPREQLRGIVERDSLGLLGLSGP